MAEFMRQPGRRVFAHEIVSSTLQFKDEEGDKSPSFLLTPTGALANRVFMVGAATEAEDISKEDSAPFWRLRITDPTGAIYAYAGQYAPDVAVTIAELEIPSFVAVLAKVHFAENEEGEIFVSLRPEWIRPAGPEVRDFWTCETAKATLERIEMLEKFISGEVEDVLLLDGTGIMAKTVDQYDDQMGQWRGMCLTALRSMKMAPPEDALEDVSNEDGNQVTDLMDGAMVFR